MSCLDFSIRREGGDLKFEVARKDGDLLLSCSLRMGLFLSLRRDKGDLSLSAHAKKTLSMRAAIVCTTNLGGEIYLWSNEGLILSVDGGRFVLKKVGDG